MAGLSLTMICMLFASTVTRAAASAECETLSEETNKECFDNVKWAMTTGIKEDPQWYSNYPFLNESTALEDFQYALATGEKADGGKKWNCTIPCFLTASAKAHMLERLEGLKHMLGNGTGNGTNTNGTGPPEEMPGVYKVLIGLGLVLLGTLIAFGASYFLCQDKLMSIFEGAKKPEKKKKRAVKSAPAAAPAPPAPTPMPVVTHHVALPTYQPIHAAPTVHVAQPVYTSSVAQPVTYHTAPSTSFVAAPMSQMSLAYAPPTA